MSEAGNEQRLEYIERSLDELATAMTRADLGALVASSDRTGEVALELRRLDLRALRTQPEARAHIERLRRTLLRCRRLGASLADAVRVARAAHGAAGSEDTYGPKGQPFHAASAVVTGRALDAQA